jgi:YD repeat-containing protein
VIEDKADSASVVSKKMVDRIGTIDTLFQATGPDKLVKLVRSGYRNMISANTQSIVCLNNPIQGNRLQLTSSGDLTDLQIINASATQFNQSWTTDQHGQPSDSSRYITGIANKYEKTLPFAYRGSGGVFYIPTSTVDSGFSFRGKLDRSGIWPTPATRPRVDTLVDIEKNFTLAPGFYYIGYSGDNNNFTYTIDGRTLSERPTKYWCIDTITLVGTSHHLSLQEINGSVPPPGYTTPYPGAIGMEIYGSRTGSPQFFSTDSFAYQHDTVSYAWRKHINPYNRGFFGNWREHGSVVFQQSRHYNANNSTRGVNVKQAGYINNFSSYWYYGTKPNGQRGWVTDTVGNRKRWVTANTVTGYDEFGQQLENKDALGRYSAAKFAFNGELPSAVASNAMNREIYTAAFEDVFFTPGQVPGYKGDIDFVQALTGLPITNFVTDTASHSGNYSAVMPPLGFTLTTAIQNKVLRTDSLLTVNTKGEFNLKPDTGLYPVGFQPVGGKKYIFDVWVKDGHSTDKSVNVSLSMNGVFVTLTCKAVVEGWKLIEGTLNLASLGTPKTLTLGLSSPLTGVCIDDLRIHPFNSQMKTYVYDDHTMRLMAEIDENGFATFYEYDDEGLLIRVKKETERGIMTIKESRSSYKKGI